MVTLTVRQIDRQRNNIASYTQDTRQIDIQMNRWLDGQMDRWIDGQMDRWIDGQMDRWIDGQILDVIDWYIILGKTQKISFFLVVDH